MNNTLLIILRAVFLGAAGWLVLLGFLAILQFLLAIA
mgnify:CR=1 FL=1